MFFFPIKFIDGFNYTLFVQRHNSYEVSRTKKAEKHSMALYFMIARKPWKYIPVCRQFDRRFRKNTLPQIQIISAGLLGI